MSIREDSVCRLCLKVPHNKFVLIDDTSRQVLDVMLVKMNFDVSNDPLMCEDCEENIKTSLSFILACLNSEKSILEFDSGEDKVKIDLRNLYAHNSNGNICADSYTCRFCIKAVKEININRLDDIMKQNLYLNIFKEYLFKMDLNIVKDALMCFDCRDKVESYFEFLRSCCVTEDKINTYLQSRKLKSGEKVMLSSVFQQFSISNLEDPWQTQVCEVKQEPSVEVKEEITIEEEGINYPLLHQNGDMSDHIWCTCDNTKGSSCLGCCAKSNEGIKIEAASPELNRASYTELDIKDEVSIKPLMSGHQDISEVMMYKCTVCDFKTKYRKSLKNHQLIHKTEAEVTMFKCTVCNFKTRRNNSLKNHLLTHKTDAELIMYKCTACDYQTKYKKGLKNHLLTHKTDAEVTMYKCAACDFKTKFKNNLRNHLLIHKTEAEVTVYKCTVCDYKTKHKKHLKDHSLIHKAEAEVTMYKCTDCDYKTRRKDNLNTHSLIHKKETEVKMYKCVTCDFKTKYRSSLKNHSLIHKTEAELTMFKCTVCDFKTIHNKSIKNHLLTHKTDADLCRNVLFH